MTCLRLYPTFVLTGLLLLASAGAAAQAANPSPASVSPAAAPAAAQQVAPSSAAPEPGATPPATNAASALSASSATSQLLLADADKLVNLAQELKSEFGKTNQYVLSLNTIRRAEDVEKLAKELQKELQHAKK